MREIKFRAWHKEEKKYHKVSKLDFVYNVAQSLINNSLQVNAFNFDDVVLEQYTGLKDKNGADIYEGDILALNEDTYTKYWENDCGDLSVTHEPVFEGKLFGVVKLTTHHGFLVFVKKAQGEFEIDIDWKKSKSTRKLKSKEKREVIGNIHENGDLLK